MKKLLFAIIAFAALSCSTEDNIPTENDCTAERAAINAQFDAQVLWVTENTSPVDYRQIELLNEERATALEHACQ